MLITHQLKKSLRKGEREANLRLDRAAGRGPLNGRDTEERKVNSVSKSGESQIREVRKIGRAGLFEEDEEEKSNFSLIGR